MNRILTILTVSGAAFCAACATGPQAGADAAAAGNTAAAATVSQPLTGSRLVKRNTDRTVRAIDSQTFKDESVIRGRGNDLGLN